MLRWATMFFVIPLLVIVAGINDVAGGIAHIATILFVVSLGALLASLLLSFFVSAPAGERENGLDGELSR